MPDRWAWEWSAARRWMTEEVLAVAAAAFDAQYTEVIVGDGHGNAHNIDPDRLPDNVRLVRSWPRPLLHMEGVAESDINACAFVGYHASSTTSSSILAHSYSGAAFRWIRLNGELCSEGYLNAALAGEFGKPVVLVSGDARTVEDAQRYAPQAIHFVAKKSIGWRSQVSLPPAQVRRLLQEAATEAFSRPKPPPFVLQGPFHLELEMTSQGAAEMLAYLPNTRRISAFGISQSFDTLASLVRFVAFAMFYSPTGVPAL